MVFKKIVVLSILITIKLHASWAQETLNTMTLDQKIGQLFIVDATTQTTHALSASLTYQSDIPLLERGQPAYVERMIKEYHVGGLIFLFRSNPRAQIEFTNRYQQMAKIPLLITLDAEWGLTMRLDETIRYPRAMTLGAHSNPQIIYQVAREIGAQCKALGVHMNIAPVVDVNNNPKNPVISDRSFGESKEEVAARGTLFMQGLRDAGILSCAKHFPGHGDTATDTHLDLGEILHPLDRLHEIELYPFKALIAAGAPAIMTAHLSIPALDPTHNLPATLSKRIITNLLRNELGFQGLILTDGMVMAGITKHHQPGHADLHAILAGNDLIIRPTDVPKAAELIKAAITDGKLTIEDLDTHVLRILRAKEWAGAHMFRPIDVEQAVAQINTPRARTLKQQSFAGAVTVVRNAPRQHTVTLVSAQPDPNNLADIFNLRTQKNSAETVLPLRSTAPIAYLQIGGQHHITLREALANHYDEVASYWISATATDQTVQTTVTMVAPYKKIVVGVFEMNKFATKNYGITPATLELLTQLHNIGKEIILVLFGNPYSLKMFGKEQAIIMAYEDDLDAQQAAADIICGKMLPSGKLPVTASEQFKARLGLPEQSNLTLIA